MSYIEQIKEAFSNGTESSELAKLLNQSYLDGYAKGYRNGSDMVMEVYEQALISSKNLLIGN